ncbi:MAG TPA: hypothetical protein VFT77_15730 [Reyranella sp.]|jgi:hypothetical protein|nr:hypothetical protein [Reyranella sp.]
MEIVRQGSRHVVPATLCALAAAACLSAAAYAEAPAAKIMAWKVEPNAQPSHYAAVAPSATNLNVASVVLACERAGDRNVLQLQLYLTDDGPLLPDGATPADLKARPGAEIAIDGRVFPASLLFGDQYAVLADRQVEGFAALSDSLVDEMANGRTMTVRLDLLADGHGAANAFDGEAVVNLEAGGGRAAIEAVRRCASPAADRTVGLVH